MSRQMIIKEDGTIAIFCTKTHTFLFDGVSIEQWIAWRIEEETDKIKDEINKTYNIIENGGNPYYQFKMTYKSACKARDRNR